MLKWNTYDDVSKKIMWKTY